MTDWLNFLLIVLVLVRDFFDMKYLLALSWGGGRGSVARAGHVSGS